MLIIVIGDSYRSPQNTAPAPRSLVSKGSGPSQPLMRRGPTIVQRRALPDLVERRENTPAAPPPPARLRLPDARERRATQAKEERRQRQRASFADSAAFAYFMGWPLSMRVTVTWDRCFWGDRDPGHVLTKPDRERSERLRDALDRRLRKDGLAFACTWSRDVGGKLGHHIHLGLYWPLPLKELAWLLARLTGSRPSSDRLPRAVLAQSECKGWQVKGNTARDEIPSAIRWTDYQLDQTPRHLVMPKLEGKLLGVSRAIDAKAMEPRREALESWKHQKGWTHHKETSNAR